MQKFKNISLYSILNSSSTDVFIFCIKRLFKENKRVPIGGQPLNIPTYKMYEAVRVKERKKDRPFFFFSIFG